MEVFLIGGDPVRGNIVLRGTQIRLYPASPAVGVAVGPVLELDAGVGVGDTSVPVKKY